MRYLWSVLLILLLVGIAFGPELVRPAPHAQDTLVLLSPHWEGITSEFERGFKEYWRKKTGGRVVQLDWWDVGGGSGEIRRFILEKARNAKWDQGEGIDVDVFFGGGTRDYANFCKDSWLARNGVVLQNGLLEPHFPPEAKDGRIPAEVLGQALRDAKGRWHAACLSGSGIVYNRVVCERAGLKPPSTWSDLGHPGYFGWVSLGDPTRSGAMHLFFEIMLQAQGWDEGWGVIVRMSANAPAFNEGSGSVPRDVAIGQAVAGPCLDFYAAAPVRRQGATHLEFVFPKGLSVVTPDPIAVFRNAPHREVAEAFVDFVLSEEGQRLWYQKRGTEGGPKKFDLERLPVLKDLYARDLPTYTIARPFADGQAFAYDEAKGGVRWAFLEELLRALILEVHEELKSSWRAVIKAGRADDLGRALGLPPFGEEIVQKLAERKLGAVQQNELRRRWTGWARERYAAIRRAAESGGPVPEYRPAPTE
jgi:ABC-type Fe3+ transport system substrate-binding protein